jgi:hypothetical protein
MREYIVQVSDPAVWEAGLWNEITAQGGGEFIPQRPVEVLNERPFNDYLAHFNLTDEEAEKLKQDSRVLTVELQADLRDGVSKSTSGARPTYNYNREYRTTADMKNWGLWRATHTTDVFNTHDSVDGAFTYNLDGAGVDIVVVDTGIEPNHPEFAVNADGTGGSRVVDFDWHSLGVAGCPTAASIGGYLGDSDGHGSNCASISAGNTCGWAPGARLYSIRIFDGNRIHKPGNYLGTINSDIAYDLVRAFHLQKIAQGNPRPTICTNSWGYSTTYSGMNSTVYRGTSHATLSRNTAYGQVNSTHGYSQVDYLNQSVNNASAAGVIMIGAAGNYYHKIDVPGGIDYDNRWLDSSGSTYYHRGSSPTCAASMITVGALDNSVTPQKAYFSESGPRVDVYSPGVMIMGAYANKSYWTSAVPDSRATGFYLNKISGTSQATPQVAGYLACVAQARPNMQAEDARQFLKDFSIYNELNEGNVAAGYANQNGLQGSMNRRLNSPFTSPNRGDITS